MMKNRAAGYKYGGSAPKPKKKMNYGGTVKKKQMPGGGMAKKPNLYKMKAGGYAKANNKDMMNAGGEKLMRGLAKKLGYEIKKK